MAYTSTSAAISVGYGKIPVQMAGRVKVQAPTLEATLPALW
jgi:hypothetical protein